MTNYIDMRYTATTFLGQLLAEMDRNEFEYRGKGIRCLLMLK